MTRDHLQRSLKMGFYGGTMALFVSVIGMVETLNRRQVIHDLISVGHTLLVIAALGAGFLAAKQVQTPSNPSGQEVRRAPGPLALGNGILAGLVVGGMLAMLVVAASLVNLRRVLVNVSPPLIELLTLGQDTGRGVLLLLALGAALGAAGGVMYVLPPRTRRALVWGLVWLALVGMLSDLLRVVLARPGLPSLLARLLVTSNGLSVPGAVSVFGVAMGLALTWRRWRQQVRAKLSRLPRGQQRAIRYGSWGVVLLFLFVLPWIVGSFPSEVLVNVGLYVLMGFGLNIVVGMAGLLDLGYVAFFAVGAYTTAILTSPRASLGAELSFWAALPIVAVVTAFTGVLIGAPVLRMRGDYLAIVTLGFGEIARFLALSDWFKPLLGGAQGIIKIPNAAIGTLAFVGPQKLYYLVLVAALMALFVTWRLENSRIGRAWMAMREDEQVAEAMGINTVYYKLLAFAMGAMIASFSGAIFAIKLGAIFPHSFSVLVSITALSLLIIGGIGSLPGVVVGALVLVGLPELLREFAEYRLLLYGAVLIVMMIVRPEGLVPSARRARELREEEKAQDAWLREMDLAKVPAARGEVAWANPQLQAGESDGS